MLHDRPCILVDGFVHCLREMRDKGGGLFIKHLPLFNFSLSLCVAPTTRKVLGWLMICLHWTLSIILLLYINANQSYESQFYIVSRASSLVTSYFCFNYFHNFWLIIAFFPRCATIYCSITSSLIGPYIFRRILLCAIFNLFSFCFVMVQVSQT